MKAIYCGLTDKGNSKKKNQDSTFVSSILSADSEAVFGIVCDGVGSYSNSEIASSQAVNAFSEWFLKCYKDISNIADEVDFRSALYERWNAVFDNVNEYIIRFAEINGIKLACTLSCILIRGDSYYILHIGDTRIYNISETIVQLTEDHTVTERNIRQGVLTRDEAKADSHRHILTKCLASKRHISPDFYSGSFADTTKFLICSDGFRNNTDDETILKTFKCNRKTNIAGLRAAAKKIIRIDRRSGEKDNITAVIIQVSKSSK